jgi:hypothetical protein
MISMLLLTIDPRWTFAADWLLLAFDLKPDGNLRQSGFVSDPKPIKTAHE